MSPGGGSPERLPGARRERSGGARRAACALVAAVAVLAAAGCGAIRYRLHGEEAGAAARFFASAADVPFPLRASFSGIAELSGRAVPFVAGLDSRTPSEETLGFYDPMGAPVLFIRNEGGIVSLTRGPAAEEGFPPADVRPVDLGAVSLGRILSGAPGYPVTGGEVGRTADGKWVLAGKGQTLFSDPSKRLLQRADYDISGKRVTVTYPGRDPTGLPRTVEVEVMGNRIVLRRDAE